MLGSITILCTVPSLAFRVSGYSYSVGEVATARRLSNAAYNILSAAPRPASEGAETGTHEKKKGTMQGGRC